MRRLILATVALVALVMTSCNGGDDAGGYAYRTRYLPVQLQGSDKWSIIDVESGAVVARDTFDVAPSAVVNDMFYMQQPNGTYNFYNIADPYTPVNAEPYGSVTSFGPDGTALVSKRGGVLTLIDKQCRVIAELPKDIAQGAMMTRGRAPIEDDRGNWGFIDDKGNIVVPVELENANAFLHDDVAVVVKPGQINDSTGGFTVIDRDGKELYRASTMTYAPIQPFYNSGVLPVVKGDTIVCLDHGGKEVPAPNDNHAAVDTAGYDDYSRTPAGLFIALKDGKMGLVDKDNKVMIPFDNDRLFDLTPTRYIAMNDTVCHLVDERGNRVGDAAFVHAHGSVDNVYAARGFIDINMAVASVLTMFDDRVACGAMPGTTLMDMNALVGNDPRPLVGRNTLTVPQGPCVIQYLFNDDIATIAADSAATFNYGARVMAVAIGLNVRHCAVDVEPAITARLSGMMGRKGFVLDKDDVFVSDAGTAVALGYIGGSANLYYFMNRAFAQPLPHQRRR